MRFRHSTIDCAKWQRRRGKVAHQVLNIAIVSVFAACRDATVQPTAAPSTTPLGAVVPGEYWQVLSLTTSNHFAYASGINDAGVIVGSAEDNLAFSRAFRYEAGQLTTYPPAPGTHMYATDVNANGQTAGHVEINGVSEPYVRQANGTLTLLPHYGSASTDNIALGINALGEVAGFTGDHRAIRWAPAFGGWMASGIPISLSFPAVRVDDINNSGWIVGTARNDDQWLAFVQRPGQSIQTIGSLAGPGGNSMGWSLNNAGKVSGSSTTATSEARVFSWTSFGGMKNETGTNMGTYSGEVTAISDKSRIAGTDSINGRLRAFTLYQGIYTVLPLVANGHGSRAYAVNSCGTVVGTVRTNAGVYHAVRWRRVVGNPPLGICD